MTDASALDRFRQWQARAPWSDWNRRRRLLVGLVFGLPVLVSGFALLGALDTSFCSVWGGQCTPDQEREIRTLSTIFWAGYLIVVGLLAAMFIVRRRTFWLVAAVLGGIGFLDALL